MSNELTTKQTQTNNFAEQFSDILLGNKELAKSYAAQTVELLSANQGIVGAIKQSEIAKRQFVSNVVFLLLNGLSLNAQTGQAYLIPFNDSQKGKTIALVLGARGYQKIARDNNINIIAETYYSSQNLSINYANSVVLHEEDFKKNNRGEVVGYYALASNLNSSKNIKVVYMTKQEVLNWGLKYSKQRKIQGANGELGFEKSSAWFSDFDMMAHKTVIKKLCRGIGLDYMTSLNKVKSKMSDVSAEDVVVLGETDEGGVEEF